MKVHGVMSLFFHLEEGDCRCTMFEMALRLLTTGQLTQLAQGIKANFPDAFTKAKINDCPYGCSIAGCGGECQDDLDDD